jgi:O-methyltransferase
MRVIYQYLPNNIKAILLQLFFRFKNRTLVMAMKDYKYTDEHLKFVHILECINYLKVAGCGGVIPPVFFEFGCHSGRTFSAAVNAARYLQLNDAQFYAFDSFVGLPETDSYEDGIFQTGSFCTNRTDFLNIVKKKTGLIVDEKNIHEGFYSETLTSKLQDRMPKVGVVHIDVDLYSSTVDVLNFIKPLLVVGTVLVFDDWYCFSPGANKGELRAVKEFCEENPLFKLEEWKSYSTFGKSFFVTSTP